MFSQLLNYFDNKKWGYQLAQETNMVLVVLQGNNVKFNAIADVQLVADRFIFYTVYPALVPEDRRSEVAELLTLFNAGRFMGNFELYHGNGEIRYKTSLDYEGGEVSDAMIDKLVMVAVTMLDNFAPAITKLIEKGGTPIEIFQEAMGDTTA